MTDRGKKPIQVPRTGTKSFPTADHAYDRALPGRHTPTAGKTGIKEGFTVQSLMPPPKNPTKK